jgi:hypothetical protein
MAKRSLKTVGAVLGGIVAALIIVSLMERLGARLYPAPRDIDLHNREALGAFMAAMPLGAFALVLAGYVIASVAGGVTATLIAGGEWARAALIVGTLLTVGGIVNLIEIPHPWWFAFLSTVAYVPSAWIGFRLVRRSP